MKTNEILKMVEWYASRRVDHFRLATLETSHDLRVALGAIKDGLDTALSQAEANRVDAERYRWLRDEGNPYAILVISGPYVDKGTRPLYDADLDAAIDAARLTNAVKTKG